MASVNKVILLGNVGRDPEARYTPNGDCIVNLSIATSDRWKDKSTGEMKEATEWHKVVFFNRQAEVIAEHVKKGSSLWVEGSLTTRKWTDKDGNEKYSTEVKAQHFQFVGKAPSQQEEAPPARRSRAAAPATDTIMDDDVPF